MSCEHINITLKLAEECVKVYKKIQTEARDGRCLDFCIKKDSCLGSFLPLGQGAITA